MAVLFFEFEFEVFAAISVIDQKEDRKLINQSFLTSSNFCKAAKKKKKN